MQFDPFLLLVPSDRDWGPGEASAPRPSAPRFETVTYSAVRRFQHKDSAGHPQTPRRDVQWMTPQRRGALLELPSRIHARWRRNARLSDLGKPAGRASKMMKPHLPGNPQNRRTGR